MKREIVYQQCPVCFDQIPTHKMLQHLKKHNGNKTNKYNARKAEADGYIFDSTDERDRYYQLKILEQAGEIHDLELQPEYKCIVNGVLVTTYHADFRYVDCDGKTVVEDVKGVRTEAFVVRKNLTMALFGIDVKEIKMR